MYLNFSNFRGRTSAGGGDKLWSKNGDKCQMGGLAKFLPDVGTPQSPQEKNPACMHGRNRHIFLRCTVIFPDFFPAVKCFSL